MKCEILTFQFAHNYGALLQCYALKKYVQSLGFDVSVSSFTPESVKNTYALWCKLNLKHPKYIVREYSRSFKRLRQYKKFKLFMKQDIGVRCCKSPDYLIVGSDQIWNEAITGKITNYYGTEYPSATKIAYAGSFGTSVLTDFQKENVIKFFSTFSSISLRETCNLEEITKIIDTKIECVLDPVFLISCDKWSEIARKPNTEIKGEYILYYALRQDETLENKVEELSYKMGCTVLSIHPTCRYMSPKFRKLNNVGPKEFIYLIKNAAIVCTNSFHAVSFSCIFKKKVMYKAYSKTESRVPTLVNYCGQKYEKEYVKEYDFSNYNNNLINGKILESKNFLREALSK